MAIEQKRKARGKMKARTLQRIRGSIAWKEFCKEPEDVRGRFLGKARLLRLQTRGVVQERQRHGRFKNVVLEDEGTGASSYAATEGEGHAKEQQEGVPSVRKMQLKFSKHCNSKLGNCNSQLVNMQLKVRKIATQS